MFEYEIRILSRFVPPLALFKYYHQIIALKRELSRRYPTCIVMDHSGHYQSADAVPRETRLPD